MKHVSAYLLVDDQRRVLLMHRTMDAPTHPDYWGFFGGKVEEGETPEQAVQREAREELGLELKDVVLFRTYEQKDEYGEQTRHIFVGPLHESLEQLRTCQQEGSGLDVFSLDQLSRIKISANDVEILREVLKSSLSDFRK